jgi:hypothetical protein
MPRSTVNHRLRTPAPAGTSSRPPRPSLRPSIFRLRNALSLLLGPLARRARRERRAPRGRLKSRGASFAYVVRGKEGGREGERERERERETPVEEWSLGTETSAGTLNGDKGRTVGPTSVARLLRFSLARGFCAPGQSTGPFKSLRIAATARGREGGEVEEDRAEGDGSSRVPS